MAKNIIYIVRCADGTELRFDYAKRAREFFRDCKNMYNKGDNAVELSRLDGRTGLIRTLLARE